MVFDYFRRGLLKLTAPFSDFIATKDQYTSIYTGSGTAGTFYTWHRPDKCTLVYIIAVGGGGGGGSGGSNLSSQPGGSGGGSGAIAKILCPAFMLPATLFIRPGVGGLGGILTGAAGANATSSYVLISPDASLTAANILLASGAAAATGGTAEGGAVGAAETVATASTAVLYQYGLIVGGVTNCVAGQAGALGGSSAVGASISALPSSTNVMTSGGAGGAGSAGTGTAFAGGAITGSGFLNTVPGGTSLTGSGVTAVAGGSFSSIARQIASVFITTGGSGGGSAGSTTTCTGGAGGGAGLGCGGGGGGGSFATSQSNPATGGKGGDGYVIIQAI